MSRRRIGIICMVVLVASVHAQKNTDKGKIQVEDKGKTFYFQSILKDVNAVNDSLKGLEQKPFARMVQDQSGMDLADNPALYQTVWSNKTISQGNTGTCWCFSTTSFYESEVLRLTGRKVDMSEMYSVYWEYVEKAIRFVEKRGNSVFDEGSESNAMSRVMKKYGAVPQSEYSGLINNRKYHTHEAMFGEMKSFLESLKLSNAWNEEYAVSTIKSILNHYLGQPPVEFIVEGKKYNPESYLKDYLKIVPDDYVEILSYKGKPYWKQVEYEVPDNWWHSADYYNVPLEDFMKALKRALKAGCSVSIGGDVSEPGFSKETNCATVPDFDIPAQYINEDARAFRFLNGSTTDDHGMQVIGLLENYKGKGFDWYLVKDSGSGSRNKEKNSPAFGYYFFREDYVKLKMMGFTVHRSAVSELLKKF